MSTEAVAAIVAQLISQHGIPRDAVPRTTPAERVAIFNALNRRAGGDETAECYERAATDLRDLWSVWHDVLGVDVSGAPREFELALKPTWSDDERRGIDAYLRANESALRILAEATARDVYNRPRQDPPRLWDMTFSSSAAKSSLAKLALVRARSDALRGATADALQWNRRARRVAEHLYQQPLWIEHAIGTAIERTVLAQLWLLLPALSRDELAEEAPRVRAISALTCPEPLLASAERLYTYDVYDAVFAWARSRDTNESTEQLIKTWVELASVGVQPEPTGPLASVDAFHEGVRATTLAQTWALQGRIESIVNEWCDLPFWIAWQRRDSLRRCWDLARDNAVVQLIGGAREGAVVELGAPNYVLHVTRGHRHATLVLLALHAHKQRTGEFPETLDELGEALSQDERRDPFSGEALIWRRADVPGGFTLYSVGPDQRDDDGRHNGFAREPGDFVYWPPPTP